jgi:transcriptional regulator GlxA family with amidase domain
MHRVGLIVPHGFQLLSVAPMTAFEMTGFGLAKPPPADSHYDLHLLSERGGPVRSSCGLTVETEAFDDPAFDTIIVGAITAFEMVASSANLIAFVQEAARASRRTASFCNGAFVLAEAGLLRGRVQRRIGFRRLISGHGFRMSGWRRTGSTSMTVRFGRQPE